MHEYSEVALFAKFKIASRIYFIYGQIHQPINNNKKTLKNEGSSSIRLRSVLVPHIFTNLQALPKSATQQNLLSYKNMDVNNKYETIELTDKL